MDTMAAPIYSRAEAEPAANVAVHDVWFAALVGFCFLIAVGFKTLAIPLWLAFATTNGTEDLLYYVFQGQNPGYDLSYLNSAPLMFPKPVTIESLLLGFCLSAVALPIFVMVERRIKSHYF